MNRLDRIKPISNHFPFIQLFLDLSNRFPTVWIESNSYPTVLGLSNRFSEKSNHLDQFKSISNHFRFIQPFSKYPTVFLFILPFPLIRSILDVSNYGWISQKWLDMNISETVARRAKRPKKVPPWVPLWGTQGGLSVQVLLYPMVQFEPHIQPFFFIQPFGPKTVRYGFESIQTVG